MLYFCANLEKKCHIRSCGNKAFSMANKGSQKISTFGSRATSTVSVCLVLIVVGVFAILGMAARGMDRQMRSSVGFTVTVQRDASSTEVSEACEAVSALTGVDTVVYISPDSILAFEEAAMGMPLALEPGVNPYSAELQVEVGRLYANADSVVKLVEECRTIDCVEDVTTDVVVLKKMDSTLSRLRLALIAAAIVLLIISVALINNTVSLSIYSRRFGIHTMRLVGASASFIRAPFVRVGAVNGFIAGLVAILLLCALRVYAATFEPMADEILPWSAMAVMCVALLLLGVIMCAVTSYFATNRYLAKSYDELFLK